MSTAHDWHIPRWTRGDRLRKAREDAGLSQIELALAMGMSRQTVSNAELGDREPLTVTLRAWADATGVPLEWLRDGVVPNATPPRRGARPARYSGSRSGARSSMDRASDYGSVVREMAPARRPTLVRAREAA